MAFRELVRPPLPMSWQPESRERQSAKRKEIGHVCRRQLYPSADKQCFSSFLIYGNITRVFPFEMIAIVARARSWIFFSAMLCLGSLGIQQEK